ncbi:4-(cytidine 5'-diphospho)-2-C-methyl-D-erythritol kinase [Acidisoma cellulosilytica]|uniref:4-diphosphocytidyl-2-C-methyl-D-erythritol kinase n=1 Tax=Acidisoma cellulosilyticum TaxID=2802395 RepID=A0A963Z6E5_9PROT|nr:4-(cytidine 5'-diphospho)-2-C-methyl-D-erythritol kinase [Acidisoma cellulosilyticum]MCB8883346.1 4-(cytidine 5'-diphospho)-2-C-methyl-D-erythritol kinase [Acidisoma cellulosilyticum]
MLSKAEALGFAPAKVNLTLRVTGRRPDGYHLLDSLVVFADVGDRLSVAPGDGLSLAVTGPFGGPLAAEPDNLVLRAGRLLAEAAGVAPNAALVLEKNLPIASGIGGGSADAAAALRLLSDFWGVALDAAMLQAIALKLGADVPVCLGCAALRMAGIGEVLSPVPVLPPLGLVLANPGLPCPTPAIFRARAAAGAGFSPADGVPEQGFSAPADFARALAASGNDLEDAAIAVQPAIGTVLATLRTVPDLLLARMSGSGATCFGLFPTTAVAAQAAAAMRRDGWWVWGGGLYEPPLRAL